MQVDLDICAVVADKALGGAWFGGPCGSHHTGGRAPWLGYGQAIGATLLCSDVWSANDSVAAAGEASPWAAVVIVMGEASVSLMTLVGVESTLLDISASAASRRKIG